MNIQIFGTSKCFDTKKAQRYFKERGIKFQMIDLKEKEMSRGEFENVARALGGWEQLVNPAAKDKQTLALLDALVDWQKEDKLFENQQLFKTPIVRASFPVKPPVRRRSFFVRAERLLPRIPLYPKRRHLATAFAARRAFFPAAGRKMRRKCENHLAIGRGFCYYEKAVLADNREGGASTNGKMSVLRQGLELRHQSEPLSPPLEPHLETQCEARQGHRGRQTPARLRMHPLPPQRQGHPRCVNCNDCTEQGSPNWASLFRIFGH